MIKVRVMYPYSPNARFDHAYYRDSHLPMVKQKTGAACLGYTIDRGLAGGAPGAPPAHVASCDLLFESVESFQAAFGAHGKAIMADVANYTDIQPIMQISEVVVG